MFKKIKNKIKLLKQIIYIKNKIGLFYVSIFFFLNLTGWAICQSGCAHPGPPIAPPLLNCILAGQGVFPKRNRFLYL